MQQIRSLKYSVFMAALACSLALPFFAHAGTNSPEIEKLRDPEFVSNCHAIISVSRQFEPQNFKKEDQFAESFYMSKGYELVGRDSFITSSIGSAQSIIKELTFLRGQKDANQKYGLYSGAPKAYFSAIQTLGQIKGYCLAIYSEFGKVQ